MLSTPTAAIASATMPGAAHCQPGLTAAGLPVLSAIAQPKPASTRLHKQPISRNNATMTSPARPGPGAEGER